MYLTELEKKLLLLSEEEFHQNVWTYIVENGTWQEVFVAIVQYNTSYYFLKNIYNIDLIYKYYNQNLRVALCISEENWKGKLNNIHSNTELYKSDKKEYFVTIEKSYVFKAGLYLVITKNKQEKDKFYVVFLENNPRIEFILRDEEYSKFYNINKELLMAHYKMKFNDFIKKENILLINKNTLIKITYLIPLREISTLSLVILALYYYQNKNNLTKNEIDTLLEMKNSIILVRKQNALSVHFIRNLVKNMYRYFEYIQNEPQIEAVKNIFSFFY